MSSRPPFRPIPFYGDCPRCGRRDLALYTPARGDGSSRVTYWHKDSDGDWCRAEVPEGWRATRRAATPKPQSTSPRCIPVEVDGRVGLARVAGELTDVDRQAIRDLLAYAAQRHAQDRNTEEDPTHE